MSALLWHADAARHLGEAFSAQAAQAAELHDYPDARLLTRIADAYRAAATSMRDELRKEVIND